MALPAYAEDSAPRRPPQVTVLEQIDVGDVLVMGNNTMDIEVANGGQRSSTAGPAAFGSLPAGAGRLLLLGEPGACVHLEAHNSGRRADAGRIQVTRVLLRSASTEGHETIDLRLDAHGQAVIEVGIRVHLSAIEQSNRWQLSLSFEARYSEECLD